MRAKTNGWRRDAIQPHHPCYFGEQPSPGPVFGVAELAGTVEQVVGELHPVELRGEGKREASEGVGDGLLQVVVREFHGGSEGGCRRGPPLCFPPQVLRAFCPGRGALRLGRSFFQSRGRMRRLPR